MAEVYGFEERWMNLLLKRSSPELVMVRIG
jgi:hypothetical protein